MKKITQFFTSNRVLLIISFLCTVIIWLTVSIVYSPISDHVISDVSVVIPLSDSERTAALKPFKGADTKVKVTVSGKKYVVSRLDASSVVVTANVDPVTVSGDYTLELSAEKKRSGDFKIESIEPSSITVSLDAEKTATFNLAIDCKGATVKNIDKENESYILEPEFDNPENAVLTVTGPEKEVSQIAKAKAVAEVNKVLETTTEYDASVMLYDQKDNLLFDGSSKDEQTLKYVNLSVTTAKISANVLLRKTLPLDFNRVNQPSNMPPITVYDVTGSDNAEEMPITTIGVKGAPSTVSKMDKITLDGEVDFSKINLNDVNTQQFRLNLPKIPAVEFEEYSNLDNVYFVVMVDVSDLSSATFDIPAENIKISNPPKDKTATIKTGLKQVTVIGKRADLNRLNYKNIVATVDCSLISTGTTITPTFTFPDGSSCFVSGSYSVTVDIS